MLFRSSEQNSPEGIWQPGSQESEQNSPEGVWHTGAYVRDVEPGEYYDDTNYPKGDLELERPGKYAYKMYRVRHDGSCGFYAFIPIMLAQLLEGGKWKKWMEDMKNTVFEPAQKELTEHASQIENTRYSTLAATNDPGELYRETMKLFEHLAQEGAPRKLQEAEMQTLANFLRQTVLMHMLIKQPQELEELYEQKRKNNWWACGDMFLCLGLPFYILHVPSQKRDDRNKHTSVWIPLYDNNDTHRDTDTSGKSIFPQKGMVVLFHHDNAYYDYLVQQEG